MEQLQVCMCRLLLLAGKKTQHLHDIHLLYVNPSVNCGVGVTRVSLPLTAVAAVPPPAPPHIHMSEHHWTNCFRWDAVAVTDWMFVQCDGHASIQLQSNLKNRISLVMDRQVFVLFSFSTCFLMINALKPDDTNQVN